MDDEGGLGAHEVDAPYVCIGCRTYRRTLEPCSICGSEVVPAAEAPEPAGPTYLPPPEPRRHGAMLVVGLVAVAGSVALGIASWIVSDGFVAFVGSGSIGLMSLAMLLPWKQRHNPSGADPVLYRGDRPVVRTSRGDEVSPIFTDAAGVTLNPASATFAEMGWPVPYVAGVLVAIVPIGCLVAAGSAFVPTLVAVLVGWAGFVTLWIRHIRREIEADGSVGRGVPL